MAETPRVYMPAPLWRALLESLKAANLKCPADMSASEDALRAVTEFLVAIPAVRDSGVVAPLEGLLAALPDLLRVGVRFNQLLDELVEAYIEQSPTTLAIGGTQLSMLVRFVEDATGGEIGATIQPARELFEAVHGRVQGVRPSMIWAASKSSRNRAHHIARAYLAAAVDWLFAANMSKEEAKAWWGRPAEYEHAHKWRERVMDRTASDLTIHVFEELKPPQRKSITEAQAKAKASELREIAKARKTDA